MGNDKRCPAPRRPSLPAPPLALPFPLAALAAVMIFFAAGVHAQHLPDELAFPRHTEEDGDDHGDDGAEPSTLFITTDQNLFDRSFTSGNNVYYTPDFGNVSLEQSAWYELRRDRLENTRQYLNAYGALSYSLANHSWITPGLDWTPVSQYSTDRGARNALATLDMGPNALLDVKGVPVLVRGGLSGRRVDSLAGFTKGGGYRSDVGAYGAFRVGSEEEALPFAPVYFYADGLGRRIEKSGMASLSGNALGALRVGEDDSLLVFGSASLFNGREGYLEESADSRAALFTETPWRIERNAGFTVGYKAARRFGIVDPSVYYAVDENRIEFPNDTRKRDEKTLRQTLSGALSTDSNAGVYYSGSLGFVWRNHDKLFGAGEMPEVRTAQNADSLDVNLWDYTAFDPRTSHRVTVRLPLSLRLKYEFGVSRFLTEYPNFYVQGSGSDTVRNRDDNDRRNSQHRAALEYKNDSSMRVEVFGEFTGYDLVFLRQAKSSSNRTDAGQKAGVIFEWGPANEFLITETLLAEAKRGEFHFPAFHQDALQRPRYSRAASSATSCDWQATDLIGLRGEWTAKYSDYGFWYGREYMEEALAKDKDARVDYYAVTSKSLYATVDLAVRVSFSEVMLEAGNAFTGARDRHYSSGYYIITNENGYTTKPYVNAAVKLREYGELQAHLSRTLVIGSSALSYWDFRLQAAGGF